MKRCPQCNREYVDDSLRFCFDDGTPLSAVTSRSEAPPTQVLPGSAATQIMSQPSAAEPDYSIPTIPHYSAPPSVRPVQPEPRRSNSMLIGGIIAGVLILLALVGIGGLFIYKQFEEEEGAKTDVNQSEGSGKKSTRPSPESSRNANADPSPETTDSRIGTPLKITASASSVRLAVQSNTYYPANAIDGKRATAWIEGDEDGPGLGEWIRFDFDREINLHRILFQPGYFKSPQIWAQNNRLRTVTAEFSDGSSRVLNFDELMESQKIDIGTVRTRWVRFVIKTVYYGTDPDTALSEVAFEWDE